MSLVAVRPDWTSPDALLGYENGLSQCLDNGYAWNAPDVLRFILMAAAHPSEPFVLILDEMNLAHVERYFADVLSGMESNDAVIPNLAEENFEWRLPLDGPTKIAFPANLFIVGTVNVDETTYMFSPKVLDRANTIEFRVATDDLSVADFAPTAIVPAAAALRSAFLRAADGTSGADRIGSARGFIDDGASSAPGCRLDENSVTAHSLKQSDSRTYW